ncbi:MAG: DEAD/DEAH box helicase, partial [Myxococcota bacterium]
MSSSSEENVQSGPSDYVSDRTFADFPISPEVLKGLTELGYSAATPVQAMMIDPALAGRDLLVRAKTGTGKTAAFSVPLVEQIAAGDRKPRGLVLTPTRELAIQVAQECAAIAKYKDLRIAVIYGGVGFGPQEQALHDGVEIVVGTPGRVLDHVKRGNLVLSELRHAVLDEADEMLSMGFLEDVRKILDRAPKDRQNIFVSATINETIKGLIGSYLKEPEEIFLSVDGQNVSNINHVLYETSPDYHKARALLDLIEQERPGSALIFCNTREDVNTVYTFLDRQGLGVEMISGELPQTRREKVMARVKAGAVQFLVATDVAARGIDISDLTHVINYALPEDAAVYLHRCGRTGRIGKMGTALTLAGGGDFSTRLTLERQHKILFEVKQLPTPEESSKLRAERIARTIKDAAGTSAYESWLDVARQLKDRPDADTIIAVALRGFFQWDRVRRAQAAEEAGEAPSEPAPRREERA